MILLNHKIIFQHVQKTGGTTIHKLFNYSANVGTCHMPCGMHFNMSDLVVTANINLKDYEVITVKRNPWDRFASLHTDTVRDYEVGRVQNAPVPWEKYFKGLQGLDDMVDKLFVNGEPPPNLTVFDFENLQNEFCPWWFDQFGYTLHSLPKLNHKPEQRYNDIRLEVVSNPIYQEIISELCAPEIEYFQWEVPSLNY